MGKIRLDNYNICRQADLTNLSAISFMLAGIVNNFSQETKKILLIGILFVIGISVPTVIICVTIISLNSKELSLTTDSMQLQFSGEASELTAVDDISNQKLQEDFNKLKKDFTELKQQAKKKKVLNAIHTQIDKIDDSVGKTELRLNDAAESSKELNKFVESAIAEP